MSGGRGGYDPVLFDLDGTLIDSVSLIRASHRHATRAVLGLELTDEALVANVGRPLIEQMQVFSSERAEELLRVYREWNHANTAALLRPFPGIEELLGRLRRAGRTLGIITSKSHPTVQLAFDVLPIAHHFDVVIAAEDTVRHKPEPEPVHEALARLGREPNGACYIGDAPFDLAAAKAADVTAIGVTWGFFPREALELEDPDEIVSTVDELGRLLLQGPV